VASRSGSLENGPEISIRYQGYLATLAGCDVEAVQPRVGLTVTGLLRHLAGRAPETPLGRHLFDRQGRLTVLVTIGGRLAGPEDSVSAGAEVCLILPAAGG